MVKMIPPGVAPKTNWSEREVFTAFEGVVDRPDWVVMHSLRLSHHLHQLEGEVDFIVFVPGKGIVVIETKNPKFVEYRDGEWYLDKVPNPTKDPLAQLSGARSSIRGFLKQTDEQLDEVPIARMLWFTNIGRHQFNNATPGDMQFFEWELGLAEDKGAPAAAIEKVLDRHIRFFEDNSAVKLNPATFTTERAHFLAQNLLQDFSGFEDSTELAKTAHKVEQRLIAEQLTVLDLIETNKHVYFDGSAGTGKSFLLVESALRLAKQGHNVLLTCWNYLMAEQLGVQARGPGIKVTDLNSLMLNICKLDSNPEGAGTEWYEQELPRMAAEAIAANPSLGDVTALCIDEFQDIAANPALLRFVLSMILATGLKQANIVLAGDKHQQIMRDGDHVVNPVANAKEIVSDLVHVRLRTNCRTAPELAKRIGEVVNVDTGVTSHRMPAGLLGVGLQLIEATDAKQAQTLSTVVRELLTRYRHADIVLLSPFGEHNSTLGKLVKSGNGSPEERWLLKQLRSDANPAGIRWSSIAKFKGLESPVVVLADVNERSAAFAQSLNKELDELLYVGLTRAKYEAVVVGETGILATN